MSTAVVAPLGINPLIALGALGFAAHGGHWKAPQGLEPLSSPWVWGALLFLGLMLKFGRSFKLTKPIAEFIGTSESVLGLISIALVAWPVTESVVSTHLQAGLATQAGLLAFGLMAYSVVCALRIAFDILIWISPFPMVDAAFQVAKLVVTVGLVLLAIFFPWLAFFLNLAIIFVSLLAIRWALRLTQFAGILIRDLVWRSRRVAELPQDNSTSTINDFGPLLIFNGNLPDWPARSKLFLWRHKGKWFVAAKAEFEASRALDDSTDAVLKREILGFTLHVNGRELLIPLRYEPVISEIAQKSGARLEGFTETFIPFFGRS